MKIILFVICAISCVLGSPVQTNGLEKTGVIPIPKFLQDLSNELLNSDKLKVTASEDDVLIYFHSRNTNDDGVLIDISQPDSLSNTDFSVSKETIFVVHGWQNDHISAVNQQVKAAYLAVKDVNIFIVDWGAVADLGYIYAQSQIESVGDIVGNFLKALVSITGISLDQITFVGHSLGAHVSGVAGAAVDGQLAHIIGLDPAGPGFDVGKLVNRLDPTDAKFVQAIHTCANLLGFGTNLGHADYWPNGGADQPGCELDLVGTCRHSRAYYLFAESVKTGNFVSKRCNDFDEFVTGNCQDGASSWMGQDNLDTNASGDYYLETNADSPYAMG